MARRSRRGFTLIELMIVSGIILLLATIAIIGFIHIDKVGSEKSTQTRLALCQSMQAEYEAVAGLKFIEGNALVTTTNPPFYQSAASGGLATQAANPNSVSSDGNRTAVPPPNPPAPILMVFTTGRIMQFFAQIPKVKNDIVQLGPAGIMQGPGGGTWTWTDLTNTTQQLYVLLDAWRNPIIYVPSTGLPNVTFGTGSNQVVKKVVSLDGRPFWASAGQDGNFATGDDNLYSVQVKALDLP